MNIDWAVTHELSSVLVPVFRRADYEWHKRHLQEVNWVTLGIDEGQISGMEGEGQGNYVEMTCNDLVRVIAEGWRQLYPLSVS